MIYYIVSVWLGPRNSKGYSSAMNIDPYYLVKQHLKFLSTLDKTDLKGAVFVVNKYNSFIDENITNIISSFKLKIPVEIIFRGNDGFSYGAWDSAIKQTLHKKFDYYFLIEDDYVPVTSDFYKPFVDKMDENTSYVSQLYKENHAAISNGLLSRKKALEVFKQHGKVFDIVDGYSTDVGTKNQVSFLRLFPENSFKDVADISFVPFLESQNDNIIDYGNKEKPVLIKPVDLPQFSFRPLEEKDLPFLNEIRNLYAPEFLHDSRTFTLEQTKEWFNKAKPEFYIMECFDREIGYFRISNYSPENKNLYIGADIHPLFTNRGLGYKAYKDFIPFIFKKYNLHKISLEVLEDNHKAFNLYKKLGFTHDGTKREEVFKHGKFVNSVIMSLLKEELNGNILQDNK